MPEITTPTGTRITLTLENDDEIVRMNGIEVGRIIQGTFQPKPFADFGLSPATMRAFADLIEGADRA